MSKKKKIILFILVFIVILGLIGGTYAYLSWVTSEEQKTQVTFTTTAGFSCSADMGGAIKSGDARIIPTTVSETTRGNYIKRELVVNPVITVDDKTIYMDLWLDINSLGTALSNSNNFRYALTTSSNNPTTGVVSSGNFNGKVVGDRIYLLDLKEYASTLSETYYLWIWLDAEETNVETAGEAFALSLNGNCYDNLPITANSLVNNANPSTLLYADASDSQKKEMWTFSHGATAQTSATTDYRYIGSSPNNYITFNDEVWRIIGVFDGRIKIIRNESIGSMSRDYKQSGVGSSTDDNGSNDWTDSQIMYMLNPTSYKLKDGYTEDGTYIYDGNSNIIYQLGCKPAIIAGGATSYSCTRNTWSLNSTALSQVGEATYYLSGSSSYSYDAETYYALERGTKVYSGRSINWTGLVGLIYPSDYAYTFANGVEDTCYTNTYNCNSNNGATPSNSWLYNSNAQLTISSSSHTARGLFYISGGGFISGDYVRISKIARPVVYLKSYIKLQGTGASDNPYEIIS